MRLGLYEKTSEETAYFLGYVSPTSPRIALYGKVLLTGTLWQFLYIKAE
jgi:hypothetical protein